QMITNTNFSPILLPGTYSLLQANSTITDFGTDKLSDLVVLAFNEKLKELKEYKSTHIDNALSNYISNTKLAFIITPINSVFDGIFLKANEFIVNYKSICMANAGLIETVFDLEGKKMLNAINAYFCGIWNSFIECVIGWIDLIGLLFKIVAAPADLYKYTQLDLPEFEDELIPVIKDFVDSLTGLDFSDLFDSILNQLSTIDISALASAGGSA